MEVILLRSLSHSFFFLFYINIARMRYEMQHAI